MVVDVKNLIAAINPKVYCSRKFERGARLFKRVERIAKGEGYLKAAEIAELIESDFIDIDYTLLYKNPFSLPGFKDPIEQHVLVYDDFYQNLEPVYFWILDYVNSYYGKSEKLVDNFISSPGSGHFAEMSKRATILRDEAMKIFGTANQVIRSIINIIYDLKEFKMRLSLYDELKSEKKQVRNAAKLSLKQLWLDNVDVKRGNSSIKGFAQQFDYVTIIDAFMVAGSLVELKKLDLNERVKRILEQRITEFEHWLKASEKELRKRFEIEKTYLKSQFSSLKLYARWIKPYLRAARELEQRAEATSALVNAFNTSLFELVLLAEGKYKPEDDVDKGELPRKFKRINIRKYSPITIIEFKFRSIPEKHDERGGYAFRGRVELTFTSFALNEDELRVLKEEIQKDDFYDVYRMIEGATDESLGQLKEDLDEFLGEGIEERKESQDVNPFLALFTFFQKKEKKEEKKETASKLILPDNRYEKVVRSMAILKARALCRKLYDTYKKARGLASFPPEIY